MFPSLTCCNQNKAKENNKAVLYLNFFVQMHFNLFWHLFKIVAQWGMTLLYGIINPCLGLLIEKLSRMNYLFDGKRIDISFWWLSVRLQ